MTTLTERDLLIRPATMDDVAIITELDGLASIDLIGVPETTENEIRVELSSIGLDLARDTRLIFTSEQQLIGFIIYFDTDEPHVHVYLWSRVHPDYKHAGIREMLLNWADERAQATLPLAPADAKVSLNHGALSTDVMMAEELTQHGYHIIRHFWRMVIELTEQPPTPVLADGITIRPYDHDTELPMVVGAMRDAFKDHWGFVEMPLDDDIKRWQHFIQDPETYDPNLVFLAMDGDEVAGVAFCWKQISEDHDMGWVGTLGVRRAWRRKGVGLALLHHAFGEFHQRGRKRVGLGVDASSLTGATGLYERAGMKVTRQFDRYEKVVRDGIELGTETVA